MSLKNLSAITKIPNSLKQKLKNKKINQIYNKFEKSISLNEKFLVAVSGGPDSLALAFLAKIYSIKKGLTSKFVIIDHKLRPESTKEAKHVKKNLKKYYIDCEILTWKGKKPKSGIQEKARDLRYNWFLEVLKSNDYDVILTAHHADDQLETFLMRLTRGSGLKGLGGMQDKKGVLVRPLLPFNKNEILSYAKKQKLNWREDISNNSTKYLRNAIRHKVIPSFTGLSTNAVVNTLSSMQYLRDAFEAIESQLEKIKATWKQDGKSFTIPLSSIEQFNPQSFWLHHLLAFSLLLFQLKNLPNILLVFY